MRSAPRKLGSVEIVLGVLWTGLVGCGFAALLDHDLRPGESIEAPNHRDSEVAPSSIDASEPAFQLMVFLHPKCPCTRATLENLHALLSRTGDRLAVELVLFEPSDPNARWESTPEIDAALTLDHVVARHDPGGIFASRYGAVTSGSTVLYDRSGERRFQGGITDSRGHSGESIGLLAIAEIVNGSDPNAITTPVFGCRILSSDMQFHPRMRNPPESQECERCRKGSQTGEQGCSTERAQ